MRLDLGLGNHFEALSSPLAGEMARQVRMRGLGLGAAALGRWDDARLPIPPDLVYAEAARLRTSHGLLARSFFAGFDSETELATVLQSARQRIAYWQSQPDAVLEAALCRLQAVARRRE